MNRKKDEIPRSIIVTKDMMQPTLAEAFTRWRDAGEWPADAVLCRLAGSFTHGPGRMRDEVTGRVFDATDAETLTHVQVKGAVPSQRFLLIVRPI